MCGRSEPVRLCFLPLPAGRTGTFSIGRTAAKLSYFSPGTVTAGALDAGGLVPLGTLGGPALGTVGLSTFGTVAVPTPGIVGVSSGGAAGLLGVVGRSVAAAGAFTLGGVVAGIAADGLCSPCEVVVGGEGAGMFPAGGAGSSGALAGAAAPAPAEAGRPRAAGLGARGELAAAAPAVCFGRARRGVGRSWRAIGARAGAAGPPAAAVGSGRVGVEAGAAGRDPGRTASCSSSASGVPTTATAPRNATAAAPALTTPIPPTKPLIDETAGPRFNAPSSRRQGVRRLRSSSSRAYRASSSSAISSNDRPPQSSRTTMLSKARPPRHRLGAQNLSAVRRSQSSSGAGMPPAESAARARSNVAFTAHSATSREPARAKQYAKTRPAFAS